MIWPCPVTVPKKKHIFSTCCIYHTLSDKGMSSFADFLSELLLFFPPTGGVLSLIAGLFVGFLAGYGAYRVSNDKRDVKLSLCKAFFPWLCRIKAWG